MHLPNPEEIEAAKTPNGGWTKKQLAEWGIAWPPPKGWKEGLGMATVTKYPAYMTGKLYRKKMGIAKTLPQDSFVVSRKYTTVAKGDRLKFLKKKAKSYSAMISFTELHNMRRGFDWAKYSAFPINNKTECYVCQKKAKIRHHVIPLSAGGRNKAGNIVPLCHGCHGEVHPHLARPTNVG